MTAFRHVCTACRSTVSVAGEGACARCRGPVTLVGSKWRAPRKTNTAAWSRVAAGELLWDRRAVERSEHAGAVRLAAMTTHAKAAQRRRLVARVQGQTPTMPHI